MSLAPRLPAPRATAPSRWAAPLLAAALMALAAACFPEPPETPLAPTPPPPATPLPAPTAAPPTGATPAPAAPPTPAPTPTPHIDRPGYGGVLTVASRVALTDLDVHRSDSSALAALGPGIVYSRLLRYADGPSAPHLIVACDLCAAWRWESATALRVTLRDGVRWHDVAPVNGRALFPADITASLERQRTAGWPQSRMLANVAAIEAQGNDLLFTLRSPDADVPRALADGYTKALPAELAARADLSFGPFIGTGPWVAAEIDPGLRYVFDANPDYFAEELPYLSRLVVRVMPDGSLRRAAFTTRALDADQLDPGEAAAFLRQHPEAGHLRADPPGGGVELAFNVRDPGWGDVRLRRAAFRAIDPWALNTQVWHGYAEVTSGMPAVTPAWRLTQAELAQRLNDPAAARALLEEAGGAPPLALLAADYGDAYLAYADGIAAQLEAAGIPVTVTPLNPAEYGRRVWAEGDFQAYLGPLPPLATPNSYLVGVVRSGAPANRTGYASPALDALIDAQAIERSEPERGALARQAALALLDDAVRFVPAAPAQVWAWWPHVTGLRPNAANREYGFWAHVSVR